jgi:cytochrome b subunit of formate dehydrogenase
MDLGTIFPTAVYVLCFLTSAACAWLLFRSYRANGARMLMWSALSFLFLALNSLAVVFDLLVLPGLDFRLVRHSLLVIALAVLLFGFIWDAED